MEFSANNAQKKNLIEKASILINGVSLTISKITKNGFEVWIIPHTYKQTNISKLKKNSLANVEIDILSKYVKKYFNEK
jgi:riboflavin synthase